MYSECVVTQLILTCLCYQEDSDMNKNSVKSYGNGIS